MTARVMIAATVLLPAVLCTTPDASATSRKSFVGAVREAGPGRVEPVTDFLYELTEPLDARVTICALFESTRARSRGTLEGLIWVLRPNQTGESCSFAGERVVEGRALVCCRTGSPDDYPDGTLVAAGIRKRGLPRIRPKDVATTQIEVFDGSIPVASTATGGAVRRSPALRAALLEPLEARPLANLPE